MHTINTIDTKKNILSFKFLICMILTTKKSLTKTQFHFKMIVNYFWKFGNNPEIAVKQQNFCF